MPMRVSWQGGGAVGRNGQEPGNEQLFGKSQMAKEPPGADDQHLDGRDGERGVREICRNLHQGRLVLPWPENQISTVLAEPQFYPDQEDSTLYLSNHS